MKRLLTLGVLAMVAGTMPAATTGTLQMSREKLAGVEESIDRELKAMYPQEPMLLIGNTRGVYLEGYGVVFSAEVVLLPGPTPSPFNPTIGKDVIARHHQTKLARIPTLKTTMFKILGNMADTLTIPESEQVVLAITLDRYSWEEKAGIPAQIVMQAPRAKITASIKNRPALEAAVKTQEF